MFKLRKRVLSQRFTSFLRPVILGLLAGGLLGTTSGAPIQLDPTFNPGTGASSTVKDITSESGGALWLAGSFSTVNGISRSGVAKLDSTGTVDPSFTTPPSVSSPVRVVPLAGGKILVGCSSMGTGLDFRQGIVRLQASGAIDTTFNAGSAINSTVNAIELLPDGKMLVGGGFTKGIAKLNPDGSADPGFTPGTGISGSVSVIRVLPSGKILVGGSFSSVNGLSRNNLCRLNSDGTPDSSFNPTGSGPGSTVYDIEFQQGGYLLIAGGFSSINGLSISYLARTSADGVPDPNFVPNPSSTVEALSLLSDGRMLIGGNFTTVGGVSSQRIALLHADGKPDPSFNTASGASSTVSAIHLLADGNLVLGGSFTTLAAVGSKYYAKILSPGNATRAGVGSIQPRSGEVGTVIQLRGSNLSNLISIEFGGSVLASFTPVSETEVSVTVPAGALPGPLVLKTAHGDSSSLTTFYPLPAPPGTLDPTFDVGTGTSSTVRSLSKDPFGRVILAGDFSSVNGTGRDDMARLFPDGSVDYSFIPPASSSSLRATAIQPDGKILVGGSSVGGKPGIARINPNGSQDTSFLTTDYASVYAIALQTDGKILIGGTFTRGITRLHPDGTQDLTFNVGTGSTSNVNAIRLQPDGKILVGGYFTTFNGSATKYITRLTTTGGIDPTFQVPGSGPSSEVKALALQADGRIVIGGSFSSFNGKSEFKYLARLHSNGALDEAFKPAPNTWVYATEITPDGRIAIGGDFTAINGNARNYVALLHADGALVSIFNTAGGPSDTVHTVLPGSIGDLLIGGEFVTISGQLPRGIARLAGDLGKTRPAITGISPDAGVAGDRIMISGSNLGTLTSVEFSGGVSATVFPISEVLTEIEVPTGTMSGPVTVRNAHGETTSLGTFKLLPKPAPLITGIPAGSVSIGSTFTVTGRNFYDVASVRLGVLTAAFTVVSATEMTVTVPANALTARVILSGPGGTAESSANLTVVKAPPVFTSASSTNGTVGKPFSFTLKASNTPTGFTANPLPAGLLFDSLTGIISGIPLADGVAPVATTATNEGGTTNGSLAITISPPGPPVVASVFPSQIATGGKFIVTGEFLFQTTSVTVGGITASFQILSDSRLVVILPAGVQSGVVQVTTLQGTISSNASVKRWVFQSGSQIVTGFGDNSSGQRTPPAGLDDVTALAAGQYHSLALRADGSVTGWGANWAGQATAPSSLLPATHIAAGGHHSLALLADGTVAAWGRNDESQCSGAGSLTDIAGLSAGGFHSLALTRLGTVKAWGSDSSGQSTVPAGLGGVVAIAAGGNFSVALKSDGSVVAWGDNASGQTDVPAAATGIVAITAGMAHVVALKSDGSLIGWGANWTGQITMPAAASPITRISAGSYHTIALRADGSCVAWGANWSSQSNEPVTTTAVAVAAGGDHSLILQAASPIPHTTPLLANGTPGQAFTLIPVTANGPFAFTAEGLPPGLAIDPLTGSISGTPTRGGDSIVTLTARNAFGITRQNLRFFIGPYIIGWGTSIPGPIPQTLSNVVRVAGGDSHGLALLNNGTVSAWGNNSYGQTTIPAGLTDVVAIAAGDIFSLALKSDGTVHGWGRNPGYPYTWVNPIATNAVAIDANGTNATALLKTGAAQILSSDYPFPFTTGNDLIAISSNPSSYFSSSYDSFVAVTRAGYLTDYNGISISMIGGFDSMTRSGLGSGYSGDINTTWGIQRDGKLFEFQRVRSYNDINQILRVETSTAIEIAAGSAFALVLNSDATAITLEPTPDPEYSYYPSGTIPQLTSDTLVDVRAIAARGNYALAIKDPTPRARFTSLRVTEGRVGQTFTHPLTTSAAPVSYSAALLPTGLTINAVTGIISGTPQTAGTFNFLAIARYATYFTTQMVSVKFTSGVAPVDITLSGATVTENLPTNSPVGTLAAMDYSPADSFTYSLVTGPGSTDNSKFKITGNQLLTNAVLDYETKQQLSIRVQVTDSGKNTFAKVFQVTVTNVFTDDDDQDGLTQSEESQLGTDPALRDSDQDGAGDGQEIAAGSSPVSAASKPANYVAVWGLNTNGQCNVPLNLGPVIAVSAGNYHTLALRADGTVAAWGQNSSAQCDVPAGLSNVIAVAAGAYHSVALKSDGTVVAWGNSSYGTVPAGLTGVIEISADDYLTAALKSDGQVVVWGSTSYGATTVPSAAQGSVHVAVGSGHILALNQAGNTVGWGDNWQGEVSGPQGSTDTIALEAGNDLSLSLTLDGRLRAWGWDIYDATNVPPDLDSVVHFSAGYYSALATRSDGSLIAWGSDSNNQSTVPPGLGPVQMAYGGYGHTVALVASTPPEHFLTSSIQSVVGLPVSRQLSYAGNADRFTAGFLPPGLTFDPLTATLTGTPAEAGTYNIRVTAEKGFSRITRIIPVHCENPRRYDEWNSVHFPGGLRAPLADSDGDSVANLLEYALHRDPTGTDPTPPATMATVSINGQNYLSLSYERFKDATDIRCLVEVSSDMLIWHSGQPATRQVSIIDHGDTETVTVRDATPFSSAAQRFIRLKVEEIPAN